MSDINYLAVAVASAAVFVASSVWYMVFGAQRAALLGPDVPVAGERPPAWKVLAELLRSAVVSLVIAGLAIKLDVDGVGASLLLGLVTWVGFPAIILSGSIMWDHVSWRLAAIHAGDWLLKLLIIAAIVGTWR